MSQVRELCGELLPARESKTPAVALLSHLAEGRARTDKTIFHLSFLICHFGRASLEFNVAFVVNIKSGSDDLKWWIQLEVQLLKLWLRASCDSVSVLY